MSEEERFRDIIQEIKETYLYLTQKEPTPDDEIEARANLIEKIESLKTVNTFQVGANMRLFEETLSKLENWDTLDLWFTESELPEYLQKIINITDEVPEVKVEEKAEEGPITKLKDDLTAAQIDIEQIVDKVSEQFKGEIDDLKQKIDVLKFELEEKDETLKKVSQMKVIKTIKPKKDVKLPPPEIKIPVITKPEKPPHVKAPAKPEVKKPKERMGVKSIGDVQAKIEREIEKLKPAQPIEEKPESILEIIKDQESTSEVLEQEALPDEPIEPESISEIIEESQPFTTLPEKPRKSPIISEVSFIEVEPSEEKKPIPFIEEEPSEEKKLIPFGDTKPKITSVSIEEVETEPVKSTGQELFNVFSSAGEKRAEKMFKPVDIFPSVPVKEKKKKEDKKQKKGEMPKTGAIPFVGFPASMPEVSEFDESTSIEMEELPSDKDSLYQELIALEGRRYSLEKNFNELEKSYNTGLIDDSGYKKQSDKLKDRLQEITTRINNIRRIISTL